MAVQVPEGPPPREGRPRLIRVEPSSSTLLILLLFLPALWVLSRLLPVLLVLVAALVIVGTVSPAVRWIEERHVRRGFAIALVFSALVLATALLLTLTIPSLVEQVTDLVDRAPDLQAQLLAWLEGSPLTRPLAAMLRNVQPSDLGTMATSDPIEFSRLVVVGLAYLLSTVFLALYIMIDRDRLRGALFLVVPRSHHMRLSRVLLNLETIVGGYIRGQVITSALMALFVFFLLKAFGAPGALAVAVFAGAADVLPYLGVLLSVGAAVAGVASRGPGVLLTVLVLMLAYEELESRLIIPRVYGRALRLPSSVILFALLAGGVLGGIPGALLSLPLAAALLMLVEELRVDLPGKRDQAEDVETRERDDREEREYERRSGDMPARQAAAIAVEISAGRQKETSAPTSTPDESADSRARE